MSAVTSTTYSPLAPSLGRWLAVGFVAGAISVLVFHQGALALLNAVGFTERSPFSMQATQPYGVPALWSLTFWGGVWGVVFAAFLSRLYGERLINASLLLGAVVPTIVAWFVVAPLKGQPSAAGFVPMAMMIGVIVNAAWGLGTGIGLALFGRKRPIERRATTADRRHSERRRSTTGTRAA